MSDVPIIDAAASISIVRADLADSGQEELCRILDDAMDAIARDRKRLNGLIATMFKGLSLVSALSEDPDVKAAIAEQYVVKHDPTR